ncbi:MAG TPA: tetratricopeptide repeat protein [Ignavibacteria bacterium]|nr:tetratricopeptide repeat protein [Ignavibacteria bacterium]
MEENSKLDNVNNFDKLWNYNKPDETEKKFREILSEVKDSGNRSAYLQLQTQIARTLGLQMKFDEAHKLLDEVESELSKDEITTARVRYLLERGRAFNSSKQKEKAKEFFLKAFELGLKSGEENYTVDAAHMMAIVESGDESLKWNGKAIQQAEKSSDQNARKWLGSLYNNTGWTYFEMKDYEKALELFIKCREWHLESKNINGIFYSKWNVAKVLRMLGKIDEAMEIQNLLREEMETGKAEMDGYVYEELGECSLINGKDNEAKDYFGKAYDLLSKDIWMVEDEKERLQRIKELGGK